jgi:DNA-binding CsgD family transcriptional regulator
MTPLRLTARQRDVVALVAAGLTRQQIADRLRVRNETVRFHLKAIARKLPGTGHELRRIRLHAREMLDQTVMAP